MKVNFKLAVAVSLLASVGVSRGEVLNFESVGENGPAPFFYQIDRSSDEAYKPYIFGDFWLNSYVIGGQAGDRSGVLVDGSNSADICSGGVVCPTGNNTSFYGGLNDGYFSFGLNSGSAFRVTAFDASIFKIDGQAYPSSSSASAILILRGWRADNTTLDSVQISVGGQENGAFAFKSYDLSLLSPTFASTDFVMARVISYAWNGVSYFSGDNLNNIALDNLTVSAVPEPSSLAMLGFGLLGIGVLLRRRMNASV